MRLLRRRAPKPQLREYPGRPIGKVEGTHVTDLAELKQTILLCWRCVEKFNSRRYHYHLAENWNKIYGGAHGACDGCRQPGPRRSVFVHQSYLGKSYDPDHA